MKVLIIVIAVVVAGLISCKQPSTKIINTLPKERAPSITNDTLSYSYTTFKRRGPDCGDKPDSECTFVSIKYPEFKNLSILNDSIKHKFLVLFLGDSTSANDTNIQKYADNFISRYEKDTIKDPSGTWKVKDEATVLSQSSGLTTIYFSGESYYGGGHGHDGFSFINWNSKTAEILKLKDIFIDHYQIPLTKIAEKIFRKQENLSDTAPLNSYSGFLIRDGIFRLTNNFLITKTGITFLYNEYEIKPFSEGTTQIDIPYSQIKSLLRPNTVITQFIK